MRKLGRAPRHKAEPERGKGELTGALGGGGGFSLRLVSTSGINKKLDRSSVLQRGTGIMVRGKKREPLY